MRRQREMEQAAWWRCTPRLKLTSLGNPRSCHGLWTGLCFTLFLGAAQLVARPRRPAMGLRFDRAPQEDLYGSFRRAQLCPAAQQDSTVSVVCSREGQASRRQRRFPRRHRRRWCRRRLITAPSPHSASQAAHADQAGCARRHTDEPDGPGMAEPPHLERLRCAVVAAAGAASADCVLRLLPGAHGSAQVEGPAVVQKVSAECRRLVGEAVACGPLPPCDPAFAAAHPHDPSALSPNRARRRARIVLALRLLHLAMTAGLRSNLEPLLPADEAEPMWRTLGRLLVAWRCFPLLVSCLGFQLAPATSAAMQAASVASVMRHARAACASPIMQQPGPQGNLARCEESGGSCAGTPLTCLPPVTACRAPCEPWLACLLSTNSADTHVGGVTIPCPTPPLARAFMPCSPCSVHRFLGSVCLSFTPSPMPPVDLPPGADPCMPLAAWALVSGAAHRPCTSRACRLLDLCAGPAAPQLNLILRSV